MPEIINILGGINARLDIVDEKISAPEGIAIEAIQNEIHRGKDSRKMIRSPVSCGTLSSSLINVTGITGGQDRRGVQKNI